MKIIAHKCKHKRRHVVYTRSIRNINYIILCGCGHNTPSSQGSCFVYDSELVRKCRYHK